MSSRKKKKAKERKKRKEEKTKKKEEERLSEFKLKSIKLLDVSRKKSKDFSLKNKLKYFIEGLEILENGAAKIGVTNESFKIVTDNWSKEINKLKKEQVVQKRDRNNDEIKKLEEIGAFSGEEEGETKGETKGKTQDVATHTFRKAEVSFSQPDGIALKPDGVNPDGGWQKQQKKQITPYFFSDELKEAQKISFDAERKKRQKSWKKWHKEKGTYKGGRKRRRKTKKRRRKTRRKTRKRKTKRKMRARAK